MQTSFVSKYGVIFSSI
jgi:mRNA deadenylase 3'-5' endonuclease subunit Ccr4